MIQIEQNSWPITTEEAVRMWQKVCELAGLGKDEIVQVRAVSPDEMHRLNRQYRHKDRATNVLTFSYGLEADWPQSDSGPEHEIFICAEVGKREARERQVPWRDYMALLLGHGLLHAAGLDHERSEKEAVRTHELEHQILRQNGFQEVVWG